MCAEDGNAAKIKKYTIYVIEIGNIMYFKRKKHTLTKSQTEKEKSDTKNKKLQRNKR